MVCDRADGEPGELRAAGDLAAAIVSTHRWLDRHSGWSPPNEETLQEWMSDRVCRCPDDCLVAPATTCPHGLVSWWLMLRTLDRPDAAEPIPPERMVPARSRFRADEPEFVEGIDAHHAALLAGEPGYLDPSSGLFVQTARQLWERGNCCEQGCRHCPFVDR